MQTNAKSQVYAGFFVRLAAFLVDMIIVNAGLVVVRFPMWIWRTNHADSILFQRLIFQYSLKDILIYGLTVTYFVLFTYYTGATLGKKLFALRVVSAEDREMTFFEVLYRETIGRFLADIILCLGYLFIIVQKEHRGLHDLLSDTSVIYYHEKKVYVHTQMNYRNMAPQPGFTVPPAPDGRNETSAVKREEGADAVVAEGSGMHEERTDPMRGEETANMQRAETSVVGGNIYGGEFTPAPNHQSGVEEQAEQPASQTMQSYVSEGYFSFDDEKNSDTEKDTENTN